MHITSSNSCRFTFFFPYCNKPVCTISSCIPLSPLYILFPLHTLYSCPPCIVYTQYPLVHYLYIPLYTLYSTVYTISTCIHYIPLYTLPIYPIVYTIYPSLYTIFPCIHYILLYIPYIPRYTLSPYIYRISPYTLSPHITAGDDYGR